MELIDDLKREGIKAEITGPVWQVTLYRPDGSPICRHLCCDNEVEAEKWLTLNARAVYPNSPAVRRATGARDCG